MLYTSGTTGRPKGVPRTHRNELSAAVSQIAHNRYLFGESALGVLPLGYNEGIPRQASGAAGLMFTRGRRVQIAGTVNMNHVILDLGAGPAEAGDEVVLFGPGDRGEATAQEWAEAIGTNSYDIVTRFTGKVPRSYCGVTATTEVDGHSSDGSADGPVAATL